MDILSFTNTSPLINTIERTGSVTGGLQETDGDLFSAVLGSAMDNIKTTNSYISDAENEELRLALGETENTHDLTIALQKASTALQYTVAIRDKFVEAYRELINMNI